MILKLPRVRTRLRWGKVDSESETKILRDKVV